MRDFASTLQARAWSGSKSECHPRFRYGTVRETRQCTFVLAVYVYSEGDKLTGV